MFNNYFQRPRFRTLKGRSSSTARWLHIVSFYRLESVSVVIRDGLEDPLDDNGMITQQLDELSVIGRCEYGKTCQLLVQLFDQAAQSYQEIVGSTGSGGPSTNKDLAVQVVHKFLEYGSSFITLSFKRRR